MILLTAIATAAVAARAASSGACGFLAKEGHLEDMLRIIRSARPGGFSSTPPCSPGWPGSACRRWRRCSTS